MRLFFLMLLLPLWLNAECTFSTKGEPKIYWEGYKTAAKVGVSGSFLGVSYHGESEAPSLEKLLVGSKAYMQTNSVFSNSAQRDSRLIQFFFNLMQAQMLEGKITALNGNETSGTLTCDITVNRRVQSVPLKYTVEEGVLKARGVIDLKDFKALDALVSLNRACYTEHAGKTWQDVTVGFEMIITKTCPKP